MRIRNLILLLTILTLCTSCAHAASFDMWWPWIYGNIKDATNSAANASNSWEWIQSNSNSIDQSITDSSFATNWIATNTLVAVEVDPVYTAWVNQSGVDFYGNSLTNVQNIYGTNLSGMVVYANGNLSLKTASGSVVIIDTPGFSGYGLDLATYGIGNVGAILFDQFAGVPTATRGRLYFDNATSKLLCYDGAVWQPLW